VGLEGGGRAKEGGREGGREGRVKCIMYIERRDALLAQAHDETQSTQVVNK